MRSSGRVYVIGCIVPAFLFSLCFFTAYYWKLAVKTVLQLLTGMRCCEHEYCYNSVAETKFHSYQALFDVGLGCGTSGIIYDAVLYCGVSSAIASSLICIAYFAKFIVNYRRDLLMFYRGEQSSVCKNMPSTTWAIGDALTFIGYQIVFFAFGWLIMMALIFIILAFIATTIVVPALGYLPDWFWPGFVRVFVWDNYAPMYISTVIINYALVWVIVRFCFQQSGKSVAIKNLTWFHHLDLFETFVSILTGPILFASRILWMFLFGFLHLVRLDVALTPKGWESWDSGYAAYTGFLYLEEFYSHPVLLTFIYHLSVRDELMEVVEDDHDDDVRRSAINSEPLSESTRLLSGRSTSPAPMRAIGQKPHRLARNRWALAYTLLNNPGLLSDRRSARNSAPADHLALAHGKLANRKRFMGSQGGVGSVAGDQ